MRLLRVILEVIVIVAIALGHVFVSLLALCAKLPPERRKTQYDRRATWERYEGYSWERPPERDE